MSPVLGTAEGYDIISQVWLNYFAFTITVPRLMGSPDWLSAEYGTVISCRTEPSNGPPERGISPSTIGWLEIEAFNV